MMVEIDTSTPAVPAHDATPSDAQPPVARRFDSAERDLGLDVRDHPPRFPGREPARRGRGAAAGDRAPLDPGANAVTNPDWEGFGGVGDYARSHGNTWEAMMAAHDLRDGKLEAAASTRPWTPASATT